MNSKTKSKKKKNHKLLRRDSYKNKRDTKEERIRKKEAEEKLKRE